jgi:hypothetical protein
MGRRLKLLVQHFLEGKLREVLQIRDHAGALI